MSHYITPSNGTEKHHTIVYHLYTRGIAWVTILLLPMALKNTTLAPNWFPTGSPLAPHWFLTGSSLAPHWLWTDSLLAPNWLPTGSELTLHWLRTGSPLAPNWLRTGSELGSELTPNWLRTGSELAPNWLPTAPTTLDGYHFNPLGSITVSTSIVYTFVL